MKLQGRNLSTEMRGADVALLHSELRQIEFTVPDDEVKKSFFGRGTMQAVKEFQEAHGLKTTGIVDEETAAAINRDVDARAPRVVMGTVTSDDGTAIGKVTVRAVDKDLRHEEVLGEVVTQRDGSYEIKYTKQQFARAEKKSADLIVSVLDRKKQVLLSSDIIFNAEPEETVDFVLDGQAGSSEYERYLEEIRPILDDAMLTALTEEDVEFISGETGIDELHVAYIATAHQYSQATKINSEAFYALFRQDLPTNLPALFVQPARILRQALETSIRTNIVPPSLQVDIERLIAAIQQQAGDHVLRSKDGNKNIERMFNRAKLANDEQEIFLKAFSQHSGDSQELWAKLESTPLAKKIEPLQNALKLNFITQNNEPLLNRLHEKNILSIRDLAKLDRTELRQIILGSAEMTSGIPGLDENEPSEQRVARYVDGIYDVLGALVPTTFVQAAFEKSSNPHRNTVARLLSNAPDLDLKDENIENFLIANPKFLEGVENAQEVKSELKRVQRVMRLANNPDHIEGLIDAGLDSAQAVATMSADEFEEEFGEKFGDKTEARSYHQRATKTSHSAVSLATTIKQAFYDVSPGIMQFVPPNLKEIPNLEMLFGSQSFCACEHCNSVLSPAAYLVDLLQFINPKRGSKPIKELRKKRPDIEHIPLTCENTNTALPYIDLVNEILEFYVANNKLTEDAAKNTKAMTAKELNVAPEHVIDEAYETLAGEVFPPILPFNRSLAISRLYLEHLGTSLSDLYAAYSRPGIDLEYLKISISESKIISGQSLKPLAEFYGFTANQNPSEFSANIAQILERTEISYDELLEILTTKFINKNDDIKPDKNAGKPDCDLSKSSLLKLTPDFWKKLHRFVRLQRKIEWSFTDIDRAFVVLGESDITERFLSKLSAVVRLEEILKLPVEVLLSYWSDLPADGADSLYRRIYRNKTLPRIPNDPFAATKLENSTEAVKDHSARICASLRIKEPDLNLLFARLGVDENTKLDLPLLSALHRYASLARALRLSINDFLTTLSLSGEDPFTPAEPSSALAQIQTYETIKKSGFKPAELSYYFLSAENASSLDVNDIRSIFEELQTGLIKIKEETADSQDVELSFSGFIVQTLGERLTLKATMTKRLIEQILKSILDPAKPATADFTQIDVIPIADFDNPAPQPLVTAFRASLTKLHKIAFLINKFRFDEREMQYLQSRSETEDFLQFDFNSVPMSPNDFSLQHFEQWKRLAQFASLKRGLPEEDATLTDVFEASQTDRDSAIDKLKKATAWKPEDVDFLVGPKGFDLQAPEDFRNEQKLLPMTECIRLSDSLGISCEQLSGLAKVKPTIETANDIVNTAKAKYTDEQWLSVAKPINDKLREAQKAALMAYVKRKTGIKDSNRLFERFLIDVEMSACMKTSRIKQAISSVQLFIQSCLMNLENVKPSAIDAEQWEWMKNYRVWEANRKVFLYPENWIEPELRDNKSEFFRELESELLQNELTAETAETAFLHYLEKLDSVARLEICGLYVQEPDENSDEEIVHVFGRTTSTPQVYYYRKLINNRTWTPWERVDLDIEGDHLMPIIHDRRLYLFWLKFEQKQNKSQDYPDGFVSSKEHFDWLSDHENWRKEHAEWQKVQDVWAAYESLLQSLARSSEEFSKSDIPPIRDQFDEANGGKLYATEPKEPSEPAFSNPPPRIHWQIKLCWGEYRNGNWSSKRTSSEYVISPMAIRTFGDFCSEKGIGSGKADYREKVARSDNTIVAAYLPEECRHYVRVSINGGKLRFEIHRRYQQSLQVVERGTKIKSGEYLGNFNLECGSKVRVNRYTYFNESIEIYPFNSGNYNNLKGPTGTTNQCLIYVKDKSEDPDKFSVWSGGETQDILSKLGEDDTYSVLPEYAKGNFKMDVPFDDFFFQDAAKTYYARYQTKPLRTLFNNSAFGAIGGSFARHSNLVNRFGNGGHKRSLNDNSRSTGKGRKVFAKKSTAITKEPLELTVKVGDSATRSLKRSGLSMKTSAALGKMSSASKGILGSGAIMGALVQEGLRFHTFFHPHICKFIEQLYQKGMPGLLSRTTQKLDHDPTSPVKNIFKERYAPSSIVAAPFPREHVDFGEGSYALYNWELFFHIPLLIAVTLMKNQRFDDAVQWFHFIFNPTTSEQAPSPQRYWKTLPFFNNAHPENQQIHKLLLTLAEKGPGWQKIEEQIDAWLDNPFNPHLIARMRITAYQKNVVMKYIDNLITWADQLFSRDTIESINEATLLYVLANTILGPRPKTISTDGEFQAKTYHDIEKDLDAFGNALVEFENAMPQLSSVFSSTTALTRAQTAKFSKLSRRAAASNDSGGRGKGVASLTAVPKPTFRPVPPLRIAESVVQSPYFCIPQNEFLLKYWDTVADRLFKIRNCMNIEGMVRELPLFEPPIDPAMLVRAAAAGVDIGSVLNELSAPVPKYRFNVMLQKAQELCNELKSLSGALLSALEKRDAETLSNMRAVHETALLKAVREIKQQQIKETDFNLDALNKTFESIQHRRTHYENLLSQDLIEEEKANLDLRQEANEIQGDALNINLTAQALSLIPDNTLGSSGVMATPVAVLTFGGTALSKAVGFFGNYVQGQASDVSYQAERSSIRAGNRRRAEEWAFQISSATKDIDQINKQILAAEIRQAIANRELENHDTQIENSKSVEEFLRSKYTSEDLYNWMLGQISKVYFQAYKLAYDLSKRAERAFRFELGLKDSNFVQFGYWDNLKKGLMAGEMLSLDLKRMEAAYLEQNRREYEITKHVSLMFHDPLQLIKLKQTGECQVSLPEMLFDTDYPGHYMRRIKSVSLTMPSVVGPFTSINCTLSLMSNETRINTSLDPQYARDTTADDERFVLNFAAQQSIATSHAQNDSGMFELNFRDERYLPFEGSGAISQWKVELPKKNNAFDFDTLTDVVFHIKYTARDGGTNLRDAASEAVENAIAGVLTDPEDQEPKLLGRLFSLKTEFPTEWYRFLNPNTGGESVEFAHKISINLEKERFPYLFRGREFSVNSVHLFLKINEGFVYEQNQVLSFIPNNEFESRQFLINPEFSLPHALLAMNGDALPFQLTLGVKESDLPSTDADEKSWWEVISQNNAGSVRLNPKAIEDIWLVCEYFVVGEP